MKKILSIILVAVMLLSLSACGSNGGNQSTNNGENITQQLIPHDEEGYYDDENYYWLMDGSGYYDDKGKFFKTETDNSSNSNQNNSDAPIKITKDNGKFVIEFSNDFVKDFDVDNNKKIKAIDIRLNNDEFQFNAANLEVGSPGENEPDIGLNVKNVKAVFSDEGKITIGEKQTENFLLKTEKSGNTFTWILDGYENILNADIQGVLIWCYEGDEKVYTFVDDYYKP